MVSQWMPQNLQKRLLKYILDQLSLFSEIDIPKINISLGGKSKINLTDLTLDHDKFRLPGLFLRNGKIKELELILTVFDGVNVDIDGLDLTISVAQPVNSKNLDANDEDQFSLARSTVNLAQSVLFNEENEDIEEHEEDDLINSEIDISESESQQSPTTDSNKQPESAKMSTTMTKAVDIALSKLQIGIKNTTVKILWYNEVYQVLIDDIAFTSNDGVRSVKVQGIHVYLVSPIIDQPMNIEVNTGDSLSNYSDNQQIMDKQEEGDNQEDQDEGYNDDLMTSSFLIDADTKGEKDSIMDTMGFSKDTTQSESMMFMTANSEILRSKSVFMNKSDNSLSPQNTIGDDKSDVDTSIPLDENHVDGSRDNELGSKVMFIDSLDFSFEGLQDINNLNVRIGSIKSSAVPLTAMLSYLLKSINQHLSNTLSTPSNFKFQSKTFTKSSTNDTSSSLSSSSNSEAETAFQKLSSAANGGSSASSPNIPSSADESNLIEHISVNEIIVSLSSELSSSGGFKDQNSIQLILRKLVFSQRSSHFSYGSIDTINILQSTKQIFYFDQPVNKSAQTVDLKFETLKDDQGISRTTLLLSKNCIFDMDYESLVQFIKFYKLIVPFIDIISSSMSTNEQQAKPQRYSSSLAHKRGISDANNERYTNQYMQSHPKEQEQIPESELSIQTSSILITLKLSEKISMKLTVLPLDYNSVGGVLGSDRISLEYIDLDSSRDDFTKPLLIINEINFSNYTKTNRLLNKKKTVKSYDTNNFQEVWNEVSSVLIFKSVDFVADFTVLNIIMDSITQMDIPSLLNDPDDFSNFERNIKNKTDTKKVKINTSLFMKSNKLIKCQFLVKSFTASVLGITPQFGDLELKMSSVGLNVFDDTQVSLLFIKKISMSRVFANGPLLEHEPIISVANKDNMGNSPFVLVRLRPSMSSVYIRNLALNYYGLWFKYFEDGNNNTNNLADNEKSPFLPSDNNSLKSIMDVQITIYDLTIGLNPVNLKSKSELVINKGNGEFSIFPNGRSSLKLTSRSVQLLLIDDCSNILSDSESKSYRVWLSNQPGYSNVTNWSLVSILKSKGFVQVGSITGFEMTFNVKPKWNPETFTKVDNTISTDTGLVEDADELVYASSELNIAGSSLNLDLCADSCQCMLQLFKDLKEPVQFTFDERFKSDTPDIDVFKDVDIDHYSPKKHNLDIVAPIGNEIVDESEALDEVISNSSLKIVEDFYNESALDSGSVSSGVTLSNDNNNSTYDRDSSGTGGILRDPNSSTNVKRIHFEDDHFQNSELKTRMHEYGLDGKSKNAYNNMISDKDNDRLFLKTIPMSMLIKVSKLVIHLYDGYDWKATQSEIRKAIKRVETKAAAEMERRRVEALESDSTRNLSEQTPTSDNERRLSQGSTGRLHQNSKLTNVGDTMSPISYSSTNTSNTSFSNNDDGNDVIGEFLFSSIMLGVKAGSNPHKLSERIDKSINFTPSLDYDSDSRSMSPMPPSATQGNNSKNNATALDSNISLGNKTSNKKLRLKRSKQYKVSIELTNLMFSMKLMTNEEPHPTFKPAYFSQNESKNDSEIVSSMTIKVEDFQILDNVPTSTWNLFTGYLREAGDREADVSMATIKIDMVRPVASLAATELVLDVSVLPLRLYVDQDTLDFLTRFGEFKDSRFIPDGNSEEDEDIFIEKIKVDAVKIKLDYKPKKVDYAGIKSGHTNEFMNFFILDESVMTLRKIILYGVPGFQRLNTLLNNSWMPDITRTQLGGVLSGLGPVKSIVKMGSGVKELLTVPIKEYQKDKRVTRGLQKGVSSFVKITGNELLKVGVKLAAGTQVLLENAEEVMGGDGSSARLYVDKDGKILEDTNFSASKQRGRRTSSTGSYITGNSIIGRKNTVHRGSMASYDEPKGDSSDDESGGDPNNLMNASLFVDSVSGDYYLYRPEESAIDDDELRDIREANGADVNISRDESSSDSDSDAEYNNEEQRVISLYSNQPTDLNSGMKNAYESFGKNLNTAKNAMLKAGSRAAESGSVKVAVQEIAKAAPIMFIRPIIGTTEAVSKTLLGGINNLDPEERKKSEEKYKKLK